MSLVLEIASDLHVGLSDLVNAERLGSSGFTFRHRRLGWQFQLLGLASAEMRVQVTSKLGGDYLRLHGPSGECVMWFRTIDAEDSTLVEVVQRATIPGMQFKFEINGHSYQTHDQLTPSSGPARNARHRLGLFTQHGQLLNLRDWLLVESEDRCRGLVALRPGCWTPGAYVEAVGTDSGCLFQSQDDARITRRSFLLVDLPTRDALRSARSDRCDGRGEGAEYMSRMAELVARHGFARTERQNIPAPDDTNAPRWFAFGSLSLVSRAKSLAKSNADFAAGWPVWTGQDAGATQGALDILTNHLAALRAGAYLHPCGNPVSARALAPALTTLHLLDSQGLLSRQDRAQAARLGAALAALLFRRDYYPHHVAMIPAGEARSVQSIYRGILNQNFNTDRYAFVGLAGCLIPTHPQAGQWRRHAIDQFNRQMAAFVYPGGAWEESHSYAVHVMLTLLPLALALRQAPEAIDLMSDPAFKTMCRFFPALLSPRTNASGGFRAVPAIGDHGLDTGTGYVSHVFAWLAAMDAEARPLHEWAWSECGAKESNSKSAHIGTFAPLFAAMLPDEPAKALSPTLPSVLELPGYGAAARCNAHAPHESLLVVRCGLSWAHYHNDQGSFWWWSHGRLICGDADLGRGAGLKHVHLGHNVLGYPGREPMQYLDRPQYVVDHVEQQEGVTRISCQLPVEAWQVASQRDEPIPPEHRPFVEREIQWRDAEQTLIVHDRPRRSPEGRVTWTIHVLATHARRIDATTVEMTITDARTRLVVKMPHTPVSLALEPCGCTFRMTATYVEGDLTHMLTVSDVPS